MAAYASLSSLAKTTHHLKTILLQTQDDAEKQLQQLPKEIESLLEKINFLLSSLEKQQHHETTGTTLTRIRDAANKTEDTIGSFLSEQHRSSSSSFVDGLSGLSRELRRVADVIGFLVDELNNNILIAEDDVDNTIITTSSSPSRQIENTEVVVGLDYPTEKLSDLVLGGSSGLRSVPVVGRGGMGKTTLVRRFYNNLLKSGEFQIYGWVTVSKSYSTRDILLSLVKSIQPFITKPKQRNESLENHVTKNLKGRRFLIVLDDVWSGVAQDFLMRIFPDDGNRSRVVLTTRLEEVGDRAGPMSLDMKFLTFEQSRELLVRKVFEKGTCPYELGGYVRWVAASCRGLPLAVVLAAGVLSSLSASKWLEFLDTLTSHHILYRSLDETVELLLVLSYTSLPHHIRPCFLYMGAFPEDHEINISELAKLWLAQGFLHGPASYLQLLVQRNLVSVLNGKSDDQRSIKSCSLHDMVRDFCIKTAREEGFFRYVADSNDDDQHVRIQIAFDLDNLTRICGSGNNDMHSIICFGSARSSLASVGRFRLLKTLKAMDIELKEEAFPLEILELFLLRFLAISHVTELPSSISNLRYLETLIVRRPIDSSSLGSEKLPGIICLPSAIWAMPMLKHAVSFSFGCLPDLTGELLENLETLSTVMNLDCSEDTVRMIPNVKKLGVFYFGVGRGTHSLENLRRLHRLEKLKVAVLVPFSSPQSLRLDYPLTLKKLHLRGIQVSPRDMKIVGELPELRVLKLVRDDFEGDEWRINSGEFPQLRYLMLEGLSVRHWVCDRAASLPMLRSLVIRGCSRLSKIPKCVDFQTLEVIDVSRGN